MALKLLKILLLLGLKDIYYYIIGLTTHNTFTHPSNLLIFGVSILNKLALVFDKMIFNGILMILLLSFIKLSNKHQTRESLFFLINMVLNCKQLVLYYIFIGNSMTNMKILFSSCLLLKPRGSLSYLSHQLQDLTLDHACASSKNIVQFCIYSI